jgi:hypothetical protein
MRDQFAVYPSEILISPHEYESLLMYYNNISREEAKKIVDQAYFKQYGVTREEHRKQSEEFWKNFDWNKSKGILYDPNR